MQHLRRCALVCGNSRRCVCVCVHAQEWARNVRAGKMSKGDKLAAVDHSTVKYAPFRRDFYIEVSELARMSPEEVVEFRKQLDEIKVRRGDARRPL
jgi:ATP-dependent RNA helicase DDX46/PRP5